MKPGYLTTEFWLTVLTLTISSILSSGLLQESSTEYKIISIIAAALAVLGYNISRGMAKGKS